MKKFLLLSVLILTFASCTEEEWDEWERIWRYDDKPGRTEIQKSNEYYEMEDLISKDSIQANQFEEYLAH